MHDNIHYSMENLCVLVLFCYHLTFDLSLVSFHMLSKNALVEILGLFQLILFSFYIFVFSQYSIALDIIFFLIIGLFVRAPCVALSLNRLDLKSNHHQKILILNLISMRMKKIGYYPGNLVTEFQIHGKVRALLVS